MARNEERDQAATHHDEGEYALAGLIARKLLENEPDDARLLAILGSACFAQQDLAGARDALERASLLAPLGPAAQFLLAACYEAEGEGDLAATMYEHLADREAPTGLLAATAARLGGLGRDEAALRACLRIQKIDPAHHQAMFGEAYYRQRLGCRPEDLVPPLARAAGAAPHLVQYRINLAFTLAGNDRPQQACGLLLAIAPEDAGCPCTLRRAAALLERGGHAGASLAWRIRLSCLLR